MTAHFRSALSLKDSKPYSSAAGADYYGSSHREQQRYYNNADCLFASSKRNQQRQQKTCFRNGECNDADWLYFRSKENFASWDIKDLAQNERFGDSSRIRHSPRRIDRISPQDDVDVEVEEIFVNSDTASPRRGNSRPGSSEDEYYEDFFRQKNEKNSRNVAPNGYRNDEDGRLVDRHTDDGNDRVSRYDDSDGIGYRYVKEMRSEKVIQVEEYRNGVRSGKSPNGVNHDARQNSRDKRKSYSGREEYDSGTIEKYERESGSLKNRSSRESNGHHRRIGNDDVSTKSSYVEKERRTGDRTAKSLERHLRPLTPPLEKHTSSSKVEETRMSSVDRRSYVSKGDEVVRNNVDSRQVMENRILEEKLAKSKKVEEEARKSLLIDSLCENNRRFATNYLKEHSKVKELYTNKDVSSTEEFVHSTPTPEQNSKSPTPSGEKSVKIYRMDSDGKRRLVEMKKNTQEINQRNVFQLESDEEEKERKETKKIQDTSETINEKKTVEESELYEEKTFITPARRRWAYRDEVKKPLLNSIRYTNNFFNKLEPI